jgi:dolichol-phosphate hexosyltransferase
MGYRLHNEMNENIMQTEKGTICVILPALNEEQSIGKVIDEIPRAELEKTGYRVEVLVVDGSSTDRTVEIAQSHGAKVLIEPRRGKGRAMRTGLDVAKADYIFMLDADYTYPATYIPQMLQLLKKYPAVIGSRLQGKRDSGSMRRFNTVGNYWLTGLANLLYLTRISDVCTGYWGFRGDVIRNLHLKSDGFQFEAELLVRLRKQGYKIGELPVNYRCREGKAKLSGLKDGFAIARFLITNRFSKA